LLSKWPESFCGQFAFTCSVSYVAALAFGRLAGERLHHKKKHNKMTLGFIVSKELTVAKGS
jgi:hypothetical protein